MGKKLIGKKSAAELASAINRLADSFFALAESLQGASDVPGRRKSAASSGSAPEAGAEFGTADAVPEDVLQNTAADPGVPGIPDVMSPVPAPVAAPAPSVDASETRCGDALQKFMKDNGFLITRIDNIINESPVWNQMARIIGRDYHAVLPIINALKVSQGRGNRVFLNLSRFDQKTRNACTNLASVLYRNALLVEYRYSSGAVPTLTMRVQKDGAIINFITGHWMEIYVYGMVREILDNYARLYSIEVETYSNVQFQMNQKETFELDVLSFVNGIPVWVECKTGEFQQSIVKYKTFGKRTGIAPEHSFLVLAGGTPEQARNITDIHRYNVISLDSFRTAFSQAMAGLCLAAGRKDPPAVPEARTAAGSVPGAFPGSSGNQDGVTAAAPSSSGEENPAGTPLTSAAASGDPENAAPDNGIPVSGSRAVSRNRSSYDRMMALISSTRPVKSLENRPEQARPSAAPTFTVPAGLYTVIDHPFLNEAMAERLKSLGVQCLSGPPVSRTEIDLDVLSRMKSGRYVLAPVLFRRIARALQTGDHSVAQSLNGCDAVQVGTTVQMCRHMADNMKVIRSFEYYSKEKSVRFDLVCNSNFSQYVLEDRRFFHAAGNVIDTVFQNTDASVCGISRNVRLCKGEVRIDLDYLVRFQDIVTAVLAGAADPEKAAGNLELAGKWLNIPARNLLFIHNFRKDSPEFASLSKKTTINALSHDEFDKTARQLMKVPEFPENAGSARIAIPELQFNPDQLYAWFSRSGVIVTEAELVSAALSALDGSASEFCRNEEIFQPLLKEVCRIHENHISRQRFVWNVEQLDGEKTSSVSNLCSSLYRTDLIRDFNYSRQSRKFIIDLDDNPDLYSFFTGGWLRYYVGSRTQKYLGQHIRDPGSVRFIRNIALELPDGDDVRIDVLICHAGDWTAIRSCTAENCIAMAEHLATAGDLLNIPRERLLLVFRSAAETRCAPPAVREAMTITAVSGFLPALEEILPEDLLAKEGPDFAELLGRIGAEKNAPETSPETAAPEAPQVSEMTEASVPDAGADPEISGPDQKIPDEAAKGLTLPEVPKEIITEVMGEEKKNTQEIVKKTEEVPGPETGEHGSLGAPADSDPPPASPEPAAPPFSATAAPGGSGSAAAAFPKPSRSEDRDSAEAAAKRPRPAISDSVLASYYQMLMDEARDQALRDDFLESHLMKPEECADFLDDENIRVMDVLRYNGQAEDADRLSLCILTDCCRNQEYGTVFNMLLEGLSRELSSFALDMDFPDEILSRYQKLLNDMMEIGLIYRNVYIRDSRESRITVLKPRALRDFITGGWFHRAGAAIVQNRLMDMTLRHPECFCLFARSAGILLDNYRIELDLVIRTMSRVLLFVFATANAEAAAGELTMLCEYMDSDPRDAVLVCLDSDPEFLARLSEKFPVSVIGLDALGEFLDSRLTPEYLESEFVPDEGSADDAPDDQDAETVLHKFGYCPGLFDYMRYEF